MAEKKRKTEKKSSRAMKNAARNLQRYEQEKPATKEEVAELLGITLKRYEAVRKDGTGLDLDKLERLHDKGNIQLDRFVTNDRGFGLIKKTKGDGSVDDSWVVIETATDEVDRTRSAAEREQFYARLLQKSADGLINSRKDTGDKDREILSEDNK